MKRIIITTAIAILTLTGCKKENIHFHEEYVVTDASTISWKGSTNFTANNGTFNTENDIIKAKNKKIIAGTITIPITSLKVLNLTGALKEQLTQHLLSPDFFNLVVHPSARFEIESIIPLPKINSSKEGNLPNSNVTGNFTLLGKTKRIVFPANILQEANQIKVLANFKINRLEWGMLYASDPNLGEHYILPEVEIGLDIVADRR